MSARGRLRGRGAGVAVRRIAEALALAGIAAIVGSNGTAEALTAQDVETAGALRGIPVPPAYYARKAADPLAFELPNGLFGPRRAIPPVANPSLVAQPAARALEGEARLPVILALFSNSAEPQFDHEEIEEAVFTGEAHTFSQFYSEISQGRFSVTGDVFPWVRTNLTMQQVVGTNDGLGDDARTGEYLIQAIDLLDPDVDWGLYDNDGPDGVPNSGDDDGVVDVVTLEFLEVAASCGGPAIWPHRWGISGWTGEPHTTADPSANGGFIQVNGYITQSVSDCTGQALQSAGTISHEYGHALGLPDYYHPVNGIEPEDRRWVLGCWALMAAGSWGCGPVENRVAFGPSHMIAHNKWQLGWLEFTEAGSDDRDVEYELAPIQTHGDALLVPLDSRGRQSLLIEYRRRVSFDSDLPSEGVLVVRRDQDGDRWPPGGSMRYFLTMLEADGDDGLLRTANEGGDRGMPSDAWGWDGSVGRINATTTPSTALGGGGPSTVTIHEIRVENGRAHIRLSTARDPQLVIPSPLPARQAVTASETRFRIAGGAAPYTVWSEDLPAGLVVTAEGDELIVSGGVRGSGEVEFEILLRDAIGSGGMVTFGMRLDPFAPSEDLLAAPFTGGRALTDLEAEALDAGGNGNGRYDVGDLRRWLFGGG